MALSRILAVVRLSRVRYLALTIPPFIIGVIGSPSHTPSYLWIGIVQIVLLRSISSIGNCISDRAEDALDHPQRVELCNLIGYNNLRRVVAGASVIYLALVVVLATALHTYWLALFFWLLYLALKLSYSFGPRLKPRRFSATGLLGSLSAGMFAVGWIGDGMNRVQTTLVGVLLLWAMGSTLSGSKDVPNLNGDASIGYRSVYRDLIESSQPLRRALAKVSIPYAAAVVLFAAGFRAQVLWCLAAYPVAVAFVVVLVRARTDIERSLVRECGYLYWLIFMGITLTALIPRVSVAAVSVAGLGWYVLASRTAHPDPTPVNLRDMRTAAHVLTRVSAQGG